MELKTKHIVNRDKKEISFLLYGFIGEKIDGDYLARELDWAGDNYDVIRLRINSLGGDKSQGLSIVSAMFASKAHIITVIEGVAASMAAVVGVSGDEVIMNDYAQLMVHDPYFVDSEGNKIETLNAKEKKMLDRSKTQLVSILAKRGKTTDEIAKLMKQETWFSAEEALAEGLVDKIAPTGRKNELSQMEPLKLVAQLTAEQTLNPDTSMKLIAKALGKPEDSTEQVLVDTITAREAEIAVREKALNDREASQIERLIANGKKAGVVNAENEPEMRELAAANFNLFVKMVDKPVEEGKEGGAGNGANSVRLSDILDAVKKQGTQTPTADLAVEFKTLSQNNSAELARIERDEPAKFKLMYDAYEKSLV